MTLASNETKLTGPPPLTRVKRGSILAGPVEGVARRTSRIAV